MKKSVKMIFTVISIITFITLIWQVKCFATDFFGISLQADSTTIQDNQTEAKFYITLTNYNPTDKDEAGFIPTLGYEAVLQYNKNVFESATIESLNNWNDAEYYESTGKILATTKNAKANTKIAQITLKLKNNANVENTTVSLSNMIVSDGKSTITVNPFINFTFAKNENNSNNPATTEPTNDEPKDTNGQTTTNDAQEKDNTSDTQNNDNQLATENGDTKEEQIKVDIAKDRTTSEDEIPQTGEGTITLALIIGTIGISIIFFMRYRHINRKIKGL